MPGFDWKPYATSGALRSDSFSGMQPGFQSALANLFAQAPENIRSQLQVKSGYRSPERQQQLWTQALAKYGSPEAARKWVAPPGNSQHNHGNAADLGYLSPDALQWAHANAGKFGLAFPLKNENWHIELATARGGKPAPVGSTMTASAGTLAPAGGAPASSIAALFNPAPAVAGGMPMGAPASIGDLALLFGQQQAQRQQQKQDEQEAEQERRRALFSADSLAGLFGAA